MSPTTFTNSLIYTTSANYSEAPPHPPREGESFPIEDAPGDVGLTDADIESNWEEAIEAFDKAIKIDPGAGQSYYNIAETYYLTMPKRR